MTDRVTLISSTSVIFPPVLTLPSYHQAQHNFPTHPPTPAHSPINLILGFPRHKSQILQIVPRYEYDGCHSFRSMVRTPRSRLSANPPASYGRARTAERKKRHSKKAIVKGNAKARDKGTQNRNTDVFPLLVWLFKEDYFRVSSIQPADIKSICN